MTMTEQPKPKLKRRNGYKGRAMRPAHRLTCGFKPVHVPLFAREIGAACDNYWRENSNLAPVGNMQLCEP